MTKAEISKFNRANVKVTHADGRTLIGRLHETPEPGLFYVQRDPSRPAVVEGGFVEDLYPQDFAKIEVLRA
jgi:hypothetical protein